MIKFWIITLLIFTVSTYILSKLTLKENRKETGEQVWRYGYGRSTYWRILCLCSIVITIVILFIMYWSGISLV